MCHTQHTKKHTETDQKSGKEKIIKNISHSLNLQAYKQKLRVEAYWYGW